jgi:hypothetical protein
VVRWVYNVGSKNPFITYGADTLKITTHQTSGFFSPQSDPFEASSTPAPILPKEPINLLEATSASIVLTIFAANVEVQLDKKMAGELLRSTLKKPPNQLRYELIYVCELYCITMCSRYWFSVFLRRGGKNMTQASRRRRKQRMLPGVCFKGFGLI